MTAVSLQPFPNKNSLTVVAADPLPNSEEGVYLTHLQARSPFVFTTAGTADALYKEDSGIPALPPFFARYGTDHFQAREMARAIQLHMSYSAPRVTVELRASSPPDDEALLALRRLNNWTITVPATLSSIVDPTSSLLVESWKLRVRPDRAPTASVTLVSKKTAFQPPPPPVTAWSNPTPDAKSLPTFVYTGLAVDAGRIYALNATDGTVYRYQSWAATAFDTKNLSGSGWRGIDVNGDLLYVVSHTPPVITRYATWASTPGETKTLPADKFYNAVAVDGEQIYALEYFTTTPRILRYSSWADADPEFKSLPHVTSTAVAYAGLAVSGGIIYVADPHNNRVIRYQSWADNDPDFKTVDHEGEQGLAYSASTLYTLADTSNTVYRYSPSP